MRQGIGRIIKQLPVPTLLQKYIMFSDLNDYVGEPMLKMISDETGHFTPHAMTGCSKYGTPV